MHKTAGIDALDISQAGGRLLNRNQAGTFRCVDQELAYSRLLVERRSKSSLKTLGTDTSKLTKNTLG